MDPSPFRLPGSTVVAPNADVLYHLLASAMFSAAVHALEARGVFHLALSGGTTPEKFYMFLVTDPRHRAMPWQQTHLWVVDERRVPEDDPRSNIKMIRETLADHAPLRRRLVHPMPVLAADPAGEYERELREAFGLQAGAEGPPRLDFILLGMGDDAHTASLFPRSKALAERKQWIAVNDGQGVTPPDRVTMTYPLINAARRAGVLVTGAKKQAALRRVAEQTERGPDAENLPITGVNPAGDDKWPVRGKAVGESALTWYLDEAAAGVTQPRVIDLA